MGCQTNEPEYVLKGDIVQEDIPYYNQMPEDIVDLHGDISNSERIYTFLEKVNQGKDDSIRVVSYTEEGAPMIHDLQYDGEVIKSITDTRRDGYGLGEINSIICNTIDIEESEERIDYSLSGCNQSNIDTMILVIWK